MPDYTPSLEEIIKTWKERSISVSAPDQLLSLGNIFEQTNYLGTWRQAAPKLISMPAYAMYGLLTHKQSLAEVRPQTAAMYSNYYSLALDLSNWFVSMLWCYQEPLKVCQCLECLMSVAKKYGVLRGKYIECVQINDTVYMVTLWQSSARGTAPTRVIAFPIDCAEGSRGYIRRAYDMYRYLMLWLAYDGIAIRASAVCKEREGIGSYWAIRGTNGLETAKLRVMKEAINVYLREYELQEMF